MVIAAGVALWIALGIGGGLLACRARRAPRASLALTLSWAALAAVVAGLAAVVPTLPERWQPWGATPLAGAAAGAFLVGLAYRLVAGRARSPERKRGWPRRVATLVLPLGTAALAYVAWFLLAVMNPRLGPPRASAILDFSGLARAARDTTLLRAELARLAGEYLARPDNAGIVVGVSFDGHRVLVSRGVASRSGARPPVDANSVFEIGSVTKVFTATALARSVVAGEVRLNQDAASLLEGDPRSPPPLQPGRFTLVDLATHRSGLPRWPAGAGTWKALTSDDPLAGFTPGELRQAVAGATARPAARRSYRYSNFGYILLGHLLENATGQPFSRLLQERVTGPLGLRRTQLVSIDTPPPGLVQGYSRGQPMPHWIGHPLAGAVGVVSTAGDLLTLSEAQMTPPSGALGEALRLAMTEQAPLWRQTTIGLAWNIERDSAGRRRIFKTGSTPGTYTYVGFSPEAKVAVVVLANSSDPAVGALGAGVLKALMRPGSAASASAPVPPAAAAAPSPRN